MLSNRLHSMGKDTISVGTQNGKYLALKKRALEEGKVVISSNMTVEDWAYRAVEIYKTRQKEVTKKKYISKMKHCVLEQIGYMPLKSVKPVHCQEVLNLLSGKSAA